MLVSAMVVMPYDVEALTVVDGKSRNHEIPGANFAWWQISWNCCAAIFFKITSFQMTCKENSIGYKTNNL